MDIPIQFFPWHQFSVLPPNSATLYCLEPPLEIEIRDSESIAEAGDVILLGEQQNRYRIVAVRTGQIGLTRVFTLKKL